MSAIKDNRFFPPRTPMTKDQISRALSLTLDHQEQAEKHGKRPFGSILLGPDNTTVLLSHYSLSHVQHAETELARLAAVHFPQPYLWQCTLVSTWEPCAMCAGTMYWANIGRLLYGASEADLRKLTGEGNQENMTLNLECREVFAKGQKDVEAIGPVDGWDKKIVESARGWWEKHR